MSKKVIESDAIQKGLNAIDDFQAKVDEATWLIKTPTMAKVRHINLHLIRLTGKLADMCHKWEHDASENNNIADDIAHLDHETMQRLIADFLIHAAQLNRIMGTKLFDVYAEQIQRNIERYAPDSDLALK